MNPIALLAQKQADDQQDRAIVRKALGPKLKVRTWDIDEEGDPNTSLTIQSDFDETLINNIIRRHNAGELILNVQKGAAEYGDFSELNEFQESLNFVIQAEKSFSEIPSEIRKQFQNDPGTFYEFVTNPANGEALVEMGLAIATEITPPPVPGTGNGDNGDDGE